MNESRTSKLFFGLISECHVDSPAGEGALWSHPNSVDIVEIKFSGTQQLIAMAFCIFVLGACQLTHVSI